MLDRPPSKSTDAIRARRRRVRRGAGLVYFGLWVHQRRLAAAMRCARRLKNGATQAEIGAALALLIEDFIEVWVGKKPTA
jgi:hypothetical protein